MARSRFGLNLTLLLVGLRQSYLGAISHWIVGASGTDMLQFGYEGVRRLIWWIEESIMPGGGERCVFFGEGGGWCASVESRGEMQEVYMEK